MIGFRLKYSTTLWSVVCIPFVVLISFSDFILPASALSGSALSDKIVDVDLTSLKNNLMALVNEGEFHETLKQLRDIKGKYGSLLVDPKTPSLFSIEGVAYHGLMEHDKALQSFENAVKFYPNETRAWVNLGETHQLTLDIPKAVDAFREAYSRGDETAAMRLLSAKGWANDWQDFEPLIGKIELYQRLCVTSRQCLLDSTLGLDYTGATGTVIRYLHTKIPNAQDSQFKIKLSNQLFESLKNKAATRRLRVGIISSDFGVHPVSSLIRGVIEMLDKKIIDLYCFSVTNQTSFWGDDIMDNAEHFIVLDNINTFEAAREIAKLKIEILIDLNGLTKNSGIPFMSHRPAPVQMSYLGLPTTTGAPFMDYYISDYVASPPEQSNQFVEHLALLPPSYIANDYAQLLKEAVIDYNCKNRRAYKGVLETDFDVTKSPILFGTLSNSQKMDPTVFQVWMNILRRFSGSKMVFMDYKPAKYSIPNLRSYAEANGISSERLAKAPQSDWLHHIFRKGSIDLILDTIAKNGHTTGLDAIWAGVPTVSLGGGNSMPKRAAESIASALGSELGLAYSLKEYEDIVFRFAKVSSTRTVPKGGIGKVCKEVFEASVDDDAIAYCVEAAEMVAEQMNGKEKLEMWRSHVEQQRTKSSLFDTRTFTKSFARLLQATWEVSRIAYFNAKHNKTSALYKAKRYHLFPGNIPKSIMSSSQLSEAAEEASASLETSHDPIQEYSQETLSKKLEGRKPRLQSLGPSEYSPIPPHLFDGRIVMLNIGGIEGKLGWINVNSQLKTLGKDVSGVTITRNMYDLQGFPDQSVSVVYSSHTLEHTSIGDKTLVATLREWHRVLRPNGMLMVGVPDLRTLLRMYLNDSFSLQDKHMVTMMIFGAQSDIYDFHMVGFDEAILTSFLAQEGFCSIHRVGNFNLWADSSSIQYRGYNISLNLIAHKCVVDMGSFDNFGIESNADPYYG